MARTPQHPVSGATGRGRAPAGNGDLAGTRSKTHLSDFDGIRQVWQTERDEPMRQSIRARTKVKMKSKLPRMRLRRAWRHYPAGAVIQPPGTLRQVLEQQGVAELIIETADAKNTATVTHVQDADSVEPTPPKKRRGHPPKTDDSAD